jgi:MFS transporter, LPLT family, lysophospholipid transporter
MNPTASKALWSRGMAATLTAQFVTALADNALLFCTLAVLQSERYPAWTQPILQEFFVGAYILLAPFAGPFADSWPKGRVMLVANALKLAGSLGILVGVNPFVAYGFVGIGAALYSPAKYGILSELTSADNLVKANGLMESSTIAAILIGAIAGGDLADWNVTGALAAVAGCYALAAVANLFIPRLPPAHVTSASPLEMIKDFRRATAELIASAEARFSLIGTSLFWGAGSTMRFLLLAWVPVALGIANYRTPAYLNAVVAVGVVIGAGLAAKLVTLRSVNRALVGGILLGAAVCAISVTTSLKVACAVLLVVGAGGGFFVVPLNALLQEKGAQSVGAGHAVAVQNLAENTAMLLMIGLYIALEMAGTPVTAVAAGFGGLFTLAIAALYAYRRNHARGAILAAASAASDSRKA